MTQAQDKAIKDILTIIKENFTAGVLITRGDESAPDGSAEIATAHIGCYSTSIGLVEIAKMHILANSK